MEVTHARPRFSVMDASLSLSTFLCVGPGSHCLRPALSRCVCVCVRVCVVCACVRVCVCELGARALSWVRHATRTMRVLDASCWRDDAAPAELVQERSAWRCCYGTGLTA